MVMVKTNKNTVSTIPVGPLGDIRTTNMMINVKRMAEKFSVFPTFHNTWYGTLHAHHRSFDFVRSFEAANRGCQVIGSR